jgi:hypothetical protein
MHQQKPCTQHLDMDLESAEVLSPRHSATPPGPPRPRRTAVRTLLARISSQCFPHVPARAPMNSKTMGRAGNGAPVLLLQPCSAPRSRAAAVLPCEEHAAFPIT